MLHARASETVGRPGLALGLRRGEYSYVAGYLQEGFGIVHVR